MAHHAPAVEQLDVDRIIRVLEEIEGSSWDRPGGRLCWTTGAWKDETRLPYLLSQRKAQSDYMAKQRIDRWVHYLRKYKVPVTPLIIFECWRHGLTGGMRRVWKQNRPSDYAQRAAALMADPTF